MPKFINTRKGGYCRKTISLDPASAQRLKAISRYLKISQSEFIRKAIAEFCEGTEDQKQISDLDFMEV